MTANSKTSDTTGAISADISRSEAAQQQDDMLPSDCPGLTGSRQFASKLSNETYDVDSSKMIPTDISRSDAAQPQDDMLPSDCPGLTGSQQFARELSNETYDVDNSKTTSTDRSRSDAAQTQDDMLPSDCPGLTGSRQFAGELSSMPQICSLAATPAASLHPALAAMEAVSPETEGMLDSCNYCSDQPDLGQAPACSKDAGPSMGSRPPLASKISTDLDISPSTSGIAPHSEHHDTASKISTTPVMNNCVETAFNNCVATHWI